MNWIENIKNRVALKSGVYKELEETVLSKNNDIYELIKDFDSQKSMEIKLIYIIESKVAQSLSAGDINNAKVKGVFK